ncbi:hypothetical protein [Lentzea sp. CA-135723]|uniref:hypothetical protein n=1 Tax=Lentzea sp. CA-135723 TaxID=3239950 RepID=UPI003D8ACDC3
MSGWAVFALIAGLVLMFGAVWGGWVLLGNALAWVSCVGWGIAWFATGAGWVGEAMFVAALVSVFGFLLMFAGVGYGRWR